MLPFHCLLLILHCFHSLDIQERLYTHRCIHAIHAVIELANHVATAADDVTSFRVRSGAPDKVHVKHYNVSDRLVWVVQKLPVLWDLFVRFSFWVYTEWLKKKRKRKTPCEQRKHLVDREKSEKSFSSPGWTTMTGCLWLTQIATLSNCTEQKTI